MFSYRGGFIKGSIVHENSEQKTIKINCSNISMIIIKKKMVKPVKDFYMFKKIECSEKMFV